MELNYKEIGQGRPLIILHGFMGSLDNWQTLARKFGENSKTFIIDQRNHGQSDHNEEMNYKVLSSDLNEFIEKHRIKNPTILGHSMGGKVAMRFALDYPEKVHSLIVADISPKPYSIHHQDILNALQSVDFDFLRDRKEVQDFLFRQVENLEIVLFLVKNIYWIKKDRLAYRFNLPVLNKSIKDISGWDDTSRQYSKPTLFLRGGNSNYIRLNEPLIEKQFPNAVVKTINGAGHWLHAEKPEEFYQLVCSFLIN